MPNWEEIRKEWETSEVTFKALAEKYGIKDSTIRSRKNREKWQRNATNKNATQRKKKVATEKKASEISWVELEKEYITDIRKKPCTLRGLAEKYKIPLQSIKEYSSKNNWTEKRNQHRTNTIQKTTEKSVELISDQLSQVTARHFQVSDKLLSAIEKALNDENELYKYVEKLRQGYGQGEFSESIEVETLDALNESKVLNLANSLEKLQKMQRQSLGILDRRDKESIQAKQREIELKQQEIDRRNAPPEKPNVDAYIEALKGRASEVWKNEEAE